MRHLILILLFASVVFADGQNDSKYKYTKTLIEGTWYVVATNFPMWLDKKHFEPSFNYYNFREKKGKLIFDDRVNYVKNKKHKQLKGRDKLKQPNELKAYWRGRGLLSLFKCTWQVIASDKEGRWIAIYSTKTLASPEGVDIIARKKDLSEAEIKSIISHLDKTYIKKPIEVLK